MGLGLTIWFILDLLLCYLTQGIIVKDTPKSIRHGAGYGSKKNGILSETSNPYANEEQTGDSLEIGISDVKSIIMEKYGRHYRLTGGSTLGIKRNKEEPINIDASNTSKEENGTVQISNSSVVLNNQDKNSTLNGTASDVNVVPSNTSGLNSTIVESESATMINSTRDGKADVVNSNGINKTTASKSDIANINENEILRDKTVHLDPSKNDSSNIEFGTPPKNETLTPKADSENNITAEGNLTTISIDLTKGDATAILPGLDINVNPLSQVDVVYGNSTNAPKRSGTNVTKPKKNIAFEISKPRMVINDFANKRKHVPHRRTVHAKKRKNILYRKKSKQMKVTK